MNNDFQIFCEKVKQNGYVRIYSDRDFSIDFGQHFSIILTASDGDKTFYLKKLIHKRCFKKYRLNYQKITFTENLDTSMFKDIFIKFYKLTPQKNFLKKLNKLKKFIVNI